MGDPAGIGGEITIKAWLRRKEGIPAFFVIDDPCRLQKLAHDMSLTVPVKAIDNVKQATATFADELPVIKQPLAVKAPPGKPDRENATAILSSIETAVRLVQSGDAGAVVTNPIHKQCMYEAGFKFPGHTELLADMSKGKAKPVMMLACKEFKVALTTIHIPLRKVIETIDTKAIIEVSKITRAALENDFAIANPRLAIAGLNPHAGEGGTIGTEDQAIVGPAVDALKATGMDVFGPVAADSLFSPDMRASYDAAICLYHDQALIPIKTIAFDRAVNITLGLDFVRTSPDHGTAFNIAGRGIASENSLIEALVTAASMAGARAANGRAFPHET